MNNENIKDKITTYWTSKSTTFKKGVGVSTILLVLMVGVFVYLYTKDSYEFLLTTTDTSVSSNVITQLKEQKIKYDVKGDSIFVADVNPDALKLELFGSGALSSTDSSLELLSKPMFISEKQESTLIQKDLENTIGGAIKSYSEVADAKVILTLGKTSSFKNDTVPSKAAVQVKLKSRLSPKQVNSIQQFVAASVPNLDKNDVVITDTDNNLISSNNSDELSMEDNDAYAKGVEDKISQQIEDLLNVAFPTSKFKVASRVEINFDKSKIEKETVNSGPDTIVSHETSSEITTNSSSSGQAGVESNVPSYETPNNNNETLSEKKTEVINYELNKVKEQIIKSPEIKKLSVAVIADQSLDTEEISKIEDLVQTAALIDEERGDKVSVQGFATDNAGDENSKESFVSKHFDQILDKSVLVFVLIVILILALKIITMFKKDKTVVTEELIVSTPVESDDTESYDNTDKPVVSSESMKKKEAIEKEIDENPQQVASVFKAWKDSNRGK